MIHMPEYSLYEAEDLFLKPIGIPDDFGFPVREDLIPKLETQISHIGKKVLFPDKKLLIHLWKFVHIFMGGGNKLHITYQEIAIQMFWKTVYHPFYRISVLP